MPAPAAVAHTHVHSLRLASGAEALVARVRLAGGAEGYGFTLNEEAVFARDMAAWDALGRSTTAPLHVLVGGTHRRRVRVEQDAGACLPPDWPALRADILASRHDILRIDPFQWASIESIRALGAAANAFDLGIALLAPNAHAWELQFCAALAATLRNEDTKIIVRAGASHSLPVSDQPGVGVSWSLEPGFAELRWQA